MDSGLHGALKHWLAVVLLAFGTGILVSWGPRPQAHPIRLALLGDVMLGRDVATSHRIRGWDETGRHLTPILGGAELAFANLESPLTLEPLVRPALDLRADPRSAAALSVWGITLVSLANNHSMDAGEEGLRDTLTALHAEGIDAVGGSALPWAEVVGGMRVRVLAFDDSARDLDASTAASQVAAQRSLADLVVVSIHWGSEWEPAPGLRQRDLASSLAAAGADVIVGHGPHVLQEVTWLWGAGRGRPTLVAYSLGNAVFDTGAPPVARRSAVLLVTASAGGVLAACGIPIELRPIDWDLEPADEVATQAILASLSPGFGTDSHGVAECAGGGE
jgi:poly-gamma-glutamate synthesis protein (capsule biosynthesis protein)